MSDPSPTPKEDDIKVFGKDLETPAKAAADTDPRGTVSEPVRNDKEKVEGKDL